ncbi:MAG TPA: RidA family protein [Anaerolineales bacterium]|jgi:2-iminobutanoate/2-iminopropanoate deaminase|nr:reactive intermediate/imine deaminase [Anaerolineaceae bacterium]HJO90972.1 RidA family protein [Anaerolineales bacterium]|tara:strand:- start:511 stop:897 length:387 start_codon:yes stop_codon:yes gene_type:complete
MTSNKTIITTNDAPAAIGPYSQATTNGQLIFTAGQIAIDPKTGTIVPGNIEAQTHRVIRNIEEILKAIGVDLQAVMKTTVFMTNLADFTRMNKVYEQYFENNPPARSALEVAALPLGAQIEIECIATK